jgi:hypothetical protein
MHQDVYEHIRYKHTFNNVEHHKANRIERHVHDVSRCRYVDAHQVVVIERSLGKPIADEHLVGGPKGRGESKVLHRHVLGIVVQVELQEAYRKTIIGNDEVRKMDMYARNKISSIDDEYAWLETE